VEEPGANGLVHRTLLVSPRLGPIAEVEVIETLRAELRRGHGGERLAELVWGQTESPAPVGKPPAEANK